MSRSTGSASSRSNPRPTSTASSWSFTGWQGEALHPERTNPPGYNSLSANITMLKAGGKRGGFVRDRHGNPVEQTTASIEQLIESGTCFAGTPDDVYDQIKALSDSVGGFGHLLMFGQGGFLGHEDTVANITLFAKEVMPRLRELNAEPQRAAVAAE